MVYTEETLDSNDVLSNEKDLWVPKRHRIDQLNEVTVNSPLARVAW